MIRVGIRELKNKLSDYLRKVEKGETVIITYHNKDFATIEPMEPLEYRKIHSFVREGSLSWYGGKPSKINNPIKPKKQKQISDIVIKDRR